MSERNDLTGCTVLRTIDQNLDILAQIPKPFKGVGCRMSHGAVQIFH